MIRKFATAAAAGALALGAFAAFGAGSGSAATVLTAGAGSTLSCNTVKAKATISPALKDNWVKADHSSDPDAAFKAIPDTSFASPGPVVIGNKTSISGCTGTLKQGATLTATVKKVTSVLSVDPAHPGLPNPATCAALFGLGSNPQPTDARYNVVSTYKSGTKGVSIADTHATNVTLAQAGAGFAISGGTITGSFAGGTSTTNVTVDGKTIAAFLSSSGLGHVVTSANPSVGAKPCQASAKNKKGVWSLKPPKGLSKIGVASGTFSESR